MSRPKKLTARRRRSPGEGSLFLRGTLGDDGVGVWTLLVGQRGGLDGKRHRKWRTFRGTAEQAKTEIARFRLQVQDGLYSDPTKDTLSKYLSERWLPHARTQVSGKTYERYAEIVALHLVPALGAVPLAHVSAVHIENAKRYWLNKGRVRKEGAGTSLSAQTVTHHLRVLNAALTQAVKWGLVPRNAAAIVEPPKGTRPMSRALDVEQAQKLLEVAKKTRMYAPIFVALTTGVRRGELLGLRWTDYDEQSATLSVRQSIEVTKGQLAFKAPKNDRWRAIKLGAETVEVLRRHRKAQHSEIFRRRQLGIAYTNLDLIFAHETGAVWNPAAFGWSFGAVVKRAEIGHVRLHDLRHSCASLLIKRGVPMKVVSERLGHSSIGITANLYTHVYAAEQDAAAEAIDALLCAHAGEQAK